MLKRCYSLRVPLKVYEFNVVSRSAHSDFLIMHQNEALNTSEGDTVACTSGEIAHLLAAEWNASILSNDFLHSRPIVRLFLILDFIIDSSNRNRPSSFNSIASSKL